MTRCFKCEKDIDKAIDDLDSWEAPCGAVLFEGGYNFGSTIYDVFVDSICVYVIICDDCLKKYKDNSKFVKEKNIKRNVVDS